jgi:[ribosomal protein S5]-alanine N-acetyltransferase
MNKKKDRPFLVGKKIYLRPFDLDDIEGEYIQWINDSEIIQNLSSLNAIPKTKADLIDYVSSILKNKDYIFFAIIENSSGKHIGNFKIGPINWIDSTTNYGRMISKEVWGKSYGTEAFQLVIKYIFETLNLNKIYGIALSRNKASLRSNEKAGMNVEGEIEEFVYKDGSYQNATILGLTRKMYFSRKLGHDTKIID